MATSERVGGGNQSKWVRPLLPLVITVVVAVVLLYIGSFIATAQGAEVGSELPLSRWAGVIVAGALVLYGLYVAFADRPIWQVGTREVVYMGIGAALYGVLSWITNYFQLPSISYVALRPAVVIPVFFGIAFGPVVGFFSGFVGNVLGDALTGWGVFPLWDVGNGLLGMIPGLLLGFRDPRRSLNALTIAVVVVALVSSLLIVINAGTMLQNFDGSQYRAGELWWVPLLSAVLVVGARYVFARRVDTSAAVIWAALGVIVGIGFAAFGGILQNGTSWQLALFGEFVPAAGSNLIAIAILLPLLIGGWAAARVRAGR